MEAAGSIIISSFYPMMCRLCSHFTIHETVDIRLLPSGLICLYPVSYPSHYCDYIPCCLSIKLLCRHRLQNKSSPHPQPSKMRSAHIAFVLGMFSIAYATVLPIQNIPVRQLWGSACYCDAQPECCTWEPSQHAFNLCKKHWCRWVAFGDWR
jgi:hypothetical protein